MSFLTTVEVLLHVADLQCKVKIRRRDCDANSKLCTRITTPLVESIFCGAQTNNLSKTPYPCPFLFIHMQLIMNMMLSSLGQEGLGYVQRWYVSSTFLCKI
jgi:hypothetical protein